MSLLVLGTDTGVGKTLVSLLILLRHGARAPLAYWKPIATGGLRGRDAAWIRRVAGERVRVLDEEYLLGRPVSPHLAAREEGVRILPSRLRAAHRRHGPGLVVEGAGGLLVPLNDRGDLQADVLATLGLPCVLVARTALGTINHTLLSLEAARARRLRVLGVVLSGPRRDGVRDAIERFGRARVVAEVPRLTTRGRPTRAAVLAASRRFDPEGALAP